MYIKRESEEVLKKMLNSFKVVLVTGPRQVGKTTLIKHVLKDAYSYVTLDDINELQVAKSDPGLFFLNNPGKLIIDEVQNAPELFKEIKRIADKSNDPGQFILTGFQTFSLMDNVSESLAGRVGILELNGLSLREINKEPIHIPFIPNAEFLSLNRKKMSNNELWNVIHRGSMPELYRNPNMDKELFYSSYVKTYIERDVR
ncbi:MAG TPA: AAA family ATPase [Erysipelothrix sp.]|nr:AAA family ATPase [Erysipelothrix sp.]